MDPVRSQLSCRVHPGDVLKGALTVPGDKSMTHRIALLGALTRGETIARGVLVSDDSRTVLRALEAMGLEWALVGDTLRLKGRGPGWQAPRGDLDLGNSGTGIWPRPPGGAPRSPNMRQRCKFVRG